MPSEDTKILELNQYQKFDKVPFIIYVDLECLIEKINGWKNNPESSSTTKVSKYILSGFSMSTISLFRSIENKHNVCWGKDCMKKFCEFLTLVIRLGFLKVAFSPHFRFQEELIQNQNNFIQLKQVRGKNNGDIISYMLTWLVHLQQANVKKSKKLI